MAKACVLVFYYERPVLAGALLESIKMQTYKDYEVLFIDDSEDPEPGKRLLESFGFNDYKYVHTQDTRQAKLARGHSCFGRYANEALLESTADFVVVTCDDDQITPWYLEQLNDFYLDSPEIMYSYCDVIVNDPFETDWKTRLEEGPSDHFLNHNHNPHCGGNSKDSSQMSFRLSCFKEGGARWHPNLTACLDYYLWLELFNLYGNAKFNGILGAIKSYWRFQLGGRGNTYGLTE